MISGIITSTPASIRDWSQRLHSSASGENLELVISLSGPESRRMITAQETLPNLSGGFRSERGGGTPWFHVALSRSLFLANPGADGSPRPGWPSASEAEAERGAFVLPWASGVCTFH